MSEMESSGGLDRTVSLANPASVLADVSAEAAPVLDDPKRDILKGMC